MSYIRTCSKKCLTGPLRSPYYLNVFKINDEPIQGFGFYLINVGDVSLAHKESLYPTNAASSVEQLGSRVGLVLLVLGGMHFFNLYVFSRLGRRSVLRHLPAPMPHDGRIAGADAAAAAGASW